MAKLGEQFTDFILDDLDLAKSSLKQAIATPEDNEESSKDFYSAMHNIKGLDGSFDYHLVTFIADSCCSLLKQTENRGPDVMTVRHAHLTALGMIIGKNIKGDGGKVEESILEDLYQANKTVLQNLESTQ